MDADQAVAGGGAYNASAEGHTAMAPYSSRVSPHMAKGRAGWPQVDIATSVLELEEKGR